MSTFISRVQDGLVTGTSNINAWYHNVDMLANNVTLIIAVGVLFIVIIYMFISYVLIGQKVNYLNDYVHNVNKLGKIYTKGSYDEEVLEKLVLDAVKELGSHVDVVSVPYFYAKPLDDIMKVFPTYGVVLKFARYIYEHDDTRSDAMHKILKKNYGNKYKTSKDIVFDVTVQISPYRKSTFKHSILVDLSRVQYVYRKNRTKANLILAKVDQEQRSK